MSKIQDFIKQDINTNPSLKEEYKKSKYFLRSSHFSTKKTRQIGNDNKEICRIFRSIRIYDQKYRSWNNDSPS